MEDVQICEVGVPLAPLNIGVQKLCMVTKLWKTCNFS